MNVAIVGAGKLGYKIAKALSGGNYSITVIDKSAALLNKISQQLDVMTINEDARQVSILKEIEIGKFDYLLTTTEDDETNMVIASFAKKLGCSHVIARVRDPEHMNQFDFIRDTLGIDHIVNPDMAITVEIHKYLAEKYSIMNGSFTMGKISLLEFPASSQPKLIGKSMPEVRAEYPDMLVLAISRKGKVFIPHGTDEIQEEDNLFMLGQNEDINKLAGHIRRKTKSSELKNIMIIGGGKTGYYLARRLANLGTYVKIVERSKDRCKYLASHLDKVMVLNGDGTDLSLLEEENVDEMDAFITATGFDEENLLLALDAKNRGIPDVISKVSHDNYKSLISNMGIDMVLNPLDITASNIIGYIQGSRRIISSMLIQGQAEIMEIRANSGMSFINTPISELKLPNDILIAAIKRGAELIIPSGSTRIQADDDVVILCLLSSIDDLEKLLKQKRA